MKDHLFLAGVPATDKTLFGAWLTKRGYIHIAKVDHGIGKDVCRLNPDLLAWRPSILARYYCAETLASDLARRIFVLPDAAIDYEALR